MKVTNILAGFTTTVAATNLYVSSYGGNITSLRLSASPHGRYTLETTALNDGSAPSPSWLTKDEYNDVIYCVDEALSGGNGSIASYKPSSDGTLTIIDRHATLNGPVSTVVYNEGKALAAALYGSHSFSSWTINPDGSLNPSQSFTFTNDSTARDFSHPHEAILDPTGSFIVVPDLGSDLLRIFSVDKKTSLLSEQPSYAVVPGSGPRHGAFLKTSSGSTFLFVITELHPTITAYLIDYPAGTKTLSMTPVFTDSTYGPNAIPPSIPGHPGSPFGAELTLSPCGQYLLTSSRGDNLFNIPNFDSTNSTKIPSDSLQVWSIDHETGALDFKQLAPAGGSWPRQFSLNKNGTLAAVVLQNDGRVVVIERNDDGTFGDFVASIVLDGEVTSVIFDE